MNTKKKNTAWLTVRTALIPVLLSATLGILLSCSAGVNIGEADKVLTSFRIEIAGGFDGTCRSNEPLLATIVPLDDSIQPFSWTGIVMLSCDSPYVTVSPASVTVVNGSAQASVAFHNSTDQNQEMKVILSFSETVALWPETSNILVYEITAPSNVSNLQTVPWDSSIKLTWENPWDDDFAGVRVLRREERYPKNSGDGTLVYDGSDTEYIDEGLKNGKPYYYSAFCYDGCPNYSIGENSIETPKDHSVTPACFPEDGGVTLFWEPDLSADSYTVYYTEGFSTPGPENGVTVDNITGTSHEVTELTNFSAYTFAVTAVKEGMEPPVTRKAAVIPPGNVLDGGNTHTVSLKDDGSVWTWGQNTYGQLGAGTTAQPTLIRVVGVEDTGFLEGAAAVTAGYEFTAALLHDGTIVTWGDNSYGQLGNGVTGGSMSTPVQVKGTGGTGVLQDVVRIAAGNSHMLAMKEDGTVWSWGNGSMGQLGDGTTGGSVSTPVQVVWDHDGDAGTEPVPFDNAVSVIASGTNSLAVRGDGTVWAWGYNSSGQLGDGTFDYRSMPVQVVGPGGIGTLENIAAVSSGGWYTLALTEDGTLYSWGNNSYGQLGDGLKGTNSAVPREVLGTGGAGTLLENVVLTAAGGSHALALKADGTVYAWGRNNYGQLGQGTGSSTDLDVPSLVTGPAGEGSFLEGAVCVAAGSNHSFALKQGGAAWAWGQNYQGQLGTYVQENYDRPEQVFHLKAVHASTSYHHTLAVQSDGTVWAWGDNSSGQLGTGGTGNGGGAHVQVLGPGGEGYLSDVQNVGAGYSFSTALKTDGTVWTWGGNTYGQLGNGTLGGSISTPVQVHGVNDEGLLEDVTAISTGSAHVLAVTEEGKCYTWGMGYYGQLGVGSESDSSTPVQVSDWTDVVSISAGYGYSLAARSDGSVWAWGYNYYGQLGIGASGDGSNSTVPVQVLGPGGTGTLTDIGKAAASPANKSHTLALKTTGDDSGTVWAWGYNSSGQLGDGSTSASSTPVQVLGTGGSGTLTGISAVACGGEFSAALKTDDTVWTWGDNTYGTLGNGDMPYGSPYPEAVCSEDGTGSLSDIMAIAAGVDHMLALDGSYTLWTWGSNDYGQLGTGVTGGAHDTPVCASGLYLGWSE